MSFISWPAGASELGLRRYAARARRCRHGRRDAVRRLPLALRIFPNNSRSRWLIIHSAIVRQIGGGRIRPGPRRDRRAVAPFYLQLWRYRR